MTKRINGFTLEVRKAALPATEDSGQCTYWQVMSRDEDGREVYYEEAWSEEDRDRLAAAEEQTLAAA